MTRLKWRIVFAAVTASALLSHAVMAQSLGDPGAMAMAGASAANETWMGALSAAACGWMVRVTIATGGTVVATIAGAVATCAYMVLDALVFSNAG